MYKIIKSIIIIFVCKILFRVKYENVEILEKYEKCMLCANHSRIYDPIFIKPKVDNMYCVAKQDLYKNKIMANLLTHYDAIPIKRNAIDRTAEKTIVDLLKNKEKIRLLIFPEGGIYKENYIENKRKTKKGAMRFAAMANVPIIPIYITSRPRYFSKVTVTFGDAIIPKQGVLEDKKLLNDEAQMLINTIYEIKKQK